ncbi:MAG: PAS domain S-box protein, partial [Puia sp.]
MKRLYNSENVNEGQVVALFEYATEGIILTDEKGEIILINPAALKLFNYEKEELLGRSIETLIPGRFHNAHLQYRDLFNEKPSNR